ncbi:SH2 domain-containing protein 7 [Ahaetulla prasina]|uniref:SH2 domain-containing protein 7 n=1 Tax=Ahaetulla prasina TaxID=499056 RepID=UPI00264997AD|nr:SH2 domain-containing protein 7 [Ahaetulla prasina]
MQNQPVGLPSTGRERQRERQPSEMLKDLILRWFLETQIALLLQEGRLPDWFHGFLTRHILPQFFFTFFFFSFLSLNPLQSYLKRESLSKFLSCIRETETLLENREFGCFLIRLNEKAFGYILSYRGKDRCRHFVISCHRSGQYVVSGDTRAHANLTELIGYYQRSEIQPFGENLTSACPKLEEKSIYDEISSDRSPSADASTPSRNPSADSLVTRNHFTNQPGHPRTPLQEEQKSLFKERQNSKEDPDAAPPIPDRSCLLESLSLEEEVGDEGTIYSAVKKLPLDKRSLGKSKEGARIFGDTKAKGSVGLGQGHSSPCQRKKEFGLAKQSDTPFTIKVNPADPAQPVTNYSRIAIDQPKNCWISAEPHNYQSTFLLSKKSAVLNYPLSKLSPTLLNKSKNSEEFHDSPLRINTRSVVNKEHGQLNQPKSLSELPKERMDEKIQPSTLWADNTTNTQESFRWAKGIFLGSEKPPKVSLSRSKGSYDQISRKFGHVSKLQINPESPYEKIPDPYSQRSSTTSQAASLEDPYEQVPYLPGKRLEGKVAQKSEKPRRFPFAEKKPKS